MTRRVATVFGGSGFIGRHLVRRFAADGWVVRVAVRHPDSALFTKTMGDVGQVVPFGCDITDRRLVDLAVAEAEVVVNLVGILAEGGQRTFERIHVEGAETIAKAAAAAGTRRLVHVSAIGADAGSTARYAQTKAKAEAAVLAAFPGATIVRPSVVFGPEDKFFNLFASLARFVPALPAFGGCGLPRLTGADGPPSLGAAGAMRFQPVYVGDVCEAIMRIVKNPATRGRTYELGGPRTYSFAEVMNLVLAEIGRRRFLLPMPFWAASAYAWFLEKLPKPPLTRDQVELLKRDNVVAANALTLRDLGIQPTAVEAIVPTYLARFRPPRLQPLARR